MLKFSSFLLLCLAIIEVNTILPPEKREELWNKYLKKISPDNFEHLEYPLYSDNLEATYTYDVDTVNSLLTKYGFPQNFNFLDEYEITPNVKNQKNCGCCWSHAATSALAYRYKLKGLDLDLSPQDGLSCYLPDCEAGNFLISPQYNLIKNGTVTEQCFPFVSGDGTTIPECPKTCKDGSEFKKYYSQNAYRTQGVITQNNYYEYVALIIDILINQGPVVSSITVYDDFQKLCQDPNKCHNEVYTYDGTSGNGGGHAITMVGYGFMNNKFYWLIQNSWGTGACDQGFVKIEFGQVGVESIAFSQPYIEEETTPVEIPVTFKSIDGYCELVAEVADEYLDKMKNSLEIQFKSDKGRYMNYQCSLMTSSIKSEYNCYIDTKDLFTPKGTYKFNSYKSLGKDNTFKIDTSKISQMTFYGIESIYPPLGSTHNLYISEAGSQLIFFYEPYYEVEEKTPYFFPYINGATALSNCKRQKYYSESNAYYLINCELTENEVSFFNTTQKIGIVYKYYCKYLASTNTYVYKLDTTNYPILRVYSAFLERIDKIDNTKPILLRTKIEGTLPNNFSGQRFLGLANIEYQNEELTYEITCNIGNPKNTTEKYSFSCYLNLDNGVSKNYNNIYILPIVIPYSISIPYELQIYKKIIVNDGSYPEPTDIEPISGNYNHIKVSKLFIFITLLLNILF